MRRYLLVDDNPAFAENLAEILRDAGDEATVVTRAAREALRAGAGTRFDALLTDMRMPVHERRGAGAPHPPGRPGAAGVVITAYTGEDDLEAARSEGLLAVLPKPVPVPRAGRAARRPRGATGWWPSSRTTPALADNLTEVLRDARLHRASPRARCWRPSGSATVQPFAALVDLRVPGGPDGEALRRLRARFPDLPMFVDHRAIRDGRAGAAHAGVFAKPFDTGALLETLERLYARAGARA